ncbi:hypothetical protein Golomagni_06837 [Golovinomyces magnicellulatus]|nr:hypothetical protein Golomagni_06837 [Golovinomyces magnicellulatus]
MSSSIIQSVAIIGGGLAGCTLALSLQQAGITPTIYESRDDNYDQGGGVMLSPNALRVLDHVGVYQKLKDSSLQFEVLTFTNVDGEKVDEYYFGSEKQYGYPAIRVMRTQLLHILRDEVKRRNIPVQYESRFSEILSDNSNGVKFSFKDGKTATASLVIGADGIQSAVRKTFLLDTKPKYAGFMGINGVVQRSDLRIPDGFQFPATVMGKSGAFLLVPQKPDGSELFIGSQRRFEELDVQGWDTLRKDKQKLHDMLLEQKNEWPDIVQSALDGMEVNRMDFWAFYGVPPLDSWTSQSGRVILIGDAAHAIPPTAGQGANQAFEDSMSLALTLSKVTDESSLKSLSAKWQQYRKERVARVLQLTNQMNVKRLPEAERSKMPPGSVWSDQNLTKGSNGELGWLYNIDIAKEVQSWTQ